MFATKERERFEHLPARASAPNSTLLAKKYPTAWDDVIGVGRTGPSAAFDCIIKSG